MKKLRDILSNCDFELLHGSTDVEVMKITFNSAEVISGAMFVAIKGKKADGHSYIGHAIENGAKVIVCEAYEESTNDIVVVKVHDTRLALSQMAANWYKHPSETMRVIGVTGTNGKTTTASMLYDIFMELGYPCGLFSTVSIIINNHVQVATHTTPDPLTIQSAMAEMRDAGCEYCFMEVSSHAIDQQRTKNIQFAAGVFTNITQDHLDYHKTFANYIAVKQKFFDQLAPDAFAIYNADDRNGKIMVQNTKAQRISYSLTRPADVNARVLRMEMGGMMLEMGNLQLWTILTGLFNAYNLMAIYATASCFYKNKQELLATLSSQKPVRGRFERVVSPDNRYGIVDYAHTPDAVENVLSTIKQLRTGNEQVIVVIGAGGNRDKTKRPIMAANACKYANTVILTSDNPRFENPKAIIDEMKEGVPEHFSGSLYVIESREEAIKVACGLSQPKDIILVAGKGHETYQEIEGVKHHFDDREILIKHLK